ncbi:MAG TPA: D-glycero-beta-D-manno-heptose 1-phosphate adenylyltransferase [Alphaproteobacteria bacterium]|nr:D-glycero-beta-D-manno-heptose 1-phosphate adenylyltransferase [Alphaproteobacteria bacterium]
MSELGQLAAYLPRFRDVRIVCVGDVMLDRYIYGDVERISPEAPIPVIRVQRETAMLGGAGNVVRNVAALGAQISLIAVIGDDEAGHMATRQIGALERVYSGLLVVPGRRTTTKTRYLVGTQQLLRADRENTGVLDHNAKAQILDIFEAELKDAGLVILSDYAKGVLDPEMLQKLISISRKAGKTVIADPKSPDFTRYAGVQVLTPNARELALANGQPCVDDAAIEAAARRACDQIGGAILVTRAQNGMSLIEAGQPVRHIAARAPEVFDESGAGDTCLATLGVALAAGAPLPDAALLANASAGLAVSKAGTAVVYMDDLAGVLHTADLQGAEAKIRNLTSAMEIAAKLRSRGKKIGFTNGCFDLVHPGHVSLLRQAREACDHLIVGLNTDASVRRLKGEGRPIQSEMARAIVLASLASVDMVILFDEETPLKLIEALRPDVLVKGADYTVEKVVGHEIVQSYGGRILLANLEEGFSTTNTIARMAR